VCVCVCVCGCVCVCVCVCVYVVARAQQHTHIYAVAARFKSSTPGAPEYVCKPCAIDISQKTSSGDKQTAKPTKNTDNNNNNNSKSKTDDDLAPKLPTSVAEFNSSSLRVGKGKAAAVKSAAKRKQRHSIIVQVPLRPNDSKAPPVPANAPPRLLSEQRTGTMGTLDSAALMSQVQEMLAAEGNNRHELWWCLIC
jgi:hypothetical protein